MSGGVLIHEIDDISRLYRPEWVNVFAATSGDEPPETYCHRFFNTYYAGRVRDEDWRIDSEDGLIARLMVRLPNLKGEFKYPELAHAHAQAQGWTDYQVATRNSKLDHDIRGYGIKKLLA